MTIIDMNDDSVMRIRFMQKYAPARREYDHVCFVHDNTPYILTSKGIDDDAGGVELDRILNKRKNAKNIFIPRIH